MPEDFEGKGDEQGKQHVMYVWFDALTNYISGLEYPDGKNAHFWPGSPSLLHLPSFFFSFSPSLLSPSPSPTPSPRL